MKKNISIVFIFFFFLNGFCQEKYIFKKLDKNTLITRLFGVKKLDPNGEGVTKYPFPNNFMYGNPEDDTTTFYTCIDTLIFYDNNYAVVVFSTNNFSYNNRNFHAFRPLMSLALFIKKDIGYQMLQFKKWIDYSGSWSSKGAKFSVLNLGSEFNCLVHKNKIDGNQGYFRGDINIYSLRPDDNFRNIFNYTYYDSNDGAIENGHTDITIHKLIRYSPLSRIELTTIRNNKKVIKRMLFEFSEEMKFYMPVIKK